jgi:flagellar hook-basal body complex protein FliE
MKIESISLPDFSQPAGAVKGKAGSSFVDTLKESISKVAELEKTADTEAQKLAKMETRDIHTTMIAIEKADLTFQLLMQIRNKIINAYEEIMRIQV